MKSSILKNLPIDITNKIILYLSVPTADIIRNALLTKNICLNYVNFPNKYHELKPSILKSTKYSEYLRVNLSLGQQFKTLGRIVQRKNNRFKPNIWFCDLIV